MQLVVSGNRILAHGEGFLAMGGTVINTETGRAYQNATVVECDGCPSDIDKVGYEYHAGQFVPCAPFGMGDGNLAVVCGEDCKSIKDSGLPLSKVSNFFAQIIVTASTGSIVTCTKGDTVLTAEEVDGTWTFDVPTYGKWTVTQSIDGVQSQKNVLVDMVAQYKIVINEGLLLRLDFEDGELEPSVNEQHTTVTLNGTVQIADGFAYSAGNGEIRMTPPVFASGAKSWHWKFKPTKIENYTQFYCDSNGTSATSTGGFSFALSAVETERGFREYGGGKSTVTVNIPLLSANTEYDVVVTMVGDTRENGVKLYLNGELVDEGSLRLDSVSCDGEHAYIGYNGASPYGFNGYIYLYEFYNRVLSAEEILAFQ